MGTLSLSLAQAGVGILALTPELATLEDLFFRLTEGNAATRSAEDRSASDAEQHKDGRQAPALTGNAAESR